MNFPAEALFELFLSGVHSTSKSLASEIRELVDPSTLSVKQHKELEQIIRARLESFAWYFFSRLDNVGCSLPPGVLGYNIIAKPCAGRPGGETVRLQEIDIRIEEQDYCNMWSDFLFRKKKDQP